MSSRSDRAELSDVLRQAISGRGEQLELARDDLLFEQRDLGEHVYLLDQGEIRVFIKNHSGDEIEVASLESGSIIGEMSLFGESRRSASCACRSTRCSLIRISNQEVLEIIQDHQKLRTTLMAELTTRCRSMLSYIDEFSSLTRLASAGDFSAVSAHLASRQNVADSTLEAAHNSFTRMLESIRKREDQLQNRIQALTIEIDQARAAREVSLIVEDDTFKTLLQNSQRLRDRLNGL